MTDHFKQNGYALLLVILVLFMGATATLYADFQPSALQLKDQYNQKQHQQLQQAKAQILLHAVSIPNLYATDTNGRFYSSDRVSAPGYLPCPDTNNNGQSNTPCGQGENFVIGQLPPGLATRHFNFYNSATTRPIWYKVDSRYVIQNSDYNNPPIQRYAPLNPNQPGDGNLSWGSRQNLIALLAYDANLLTQTNTPPQQAMMVSISHQEWANALKQRLRNQAPHLCQLDPLQAHWFNQCNNQEGYNPECPAIYDGRPSNPVGANWRDLLCN